MSDNAPNPNYTIALLVLVSMGLLFASYMKISYSREKRAAAAVESESASSIDRFIETPQGEAALNKFIVGDRHGSCGSDDEFLASIKNSNSGSAPSEAYVKNYLHNKCALYSAARSELEAIDEKH